MTFTQTDLDALKEALVSGVLEVSIGDRRVKYRTQAELLAVIKMVEDSMEASTDLESNPSMIQAGFKRGGS